MAFVTGRAVHPSDASTEVFERIVEDKGESDGPARHASTGQVPVVRRSVAERSTETAAADEDDDAWSPVPVPRPTYTMKASAPRREPVPLENLEGSTAARTADVEAPAGDRARAARGARRDDRQHRPERGPGQASRRRGVTRPDFAIHRALVLVFSPLAGLWRSW